MDWPGLRRSECAAIVSIKVKCANACLALTTAAKYAAITTLVVWATPPLLGFTASGVAANSLAAAIQSACYGGFVPARSLFAILQSVGATGTIVPGIIAGLGAGVSRIIVDALAHAYQAAAAHIKRLLADLLRKLVIVGALAAIDLRRIVRGQEAIGA